jgi:galactosylceramidase
MAGSTGSKTTQAAMSAVVEVNVEGAGRTFEGIGAVSAGAATRLLIDYPESQRSEILDYLFKPGFGASLQHLKVEIGGDTITGCGSEPSHMHSGTEASFARGYEWWLMTEAKARNPAVRLDALAWGAPGWVGDRYTQAAIDYLVRFVESAERIHGLRIDYIGIWNEADIRNERGINVETVTHLPPTAITWVKQLKRAVEPFGTRLVAADQVDHWTIVEQMLADPELLQAVDVVGVHYPGYSEYFNAGLSPDQPPPTYGSTPQARATSKPLWSSEGGPARGDWFGACELSKMLNRNYIEGRMTKTEMWALVSSYYASLVESWPHAGLMDANQPWSGHYSVNPAIWAAAHTTQFAQPGWRYLDGACGYLDEEASQGSYVTLLDPSLGDWSLIVETIDAERPQTVTVRCKGRRPGLLHLWRTNREEQFMKLEVLGPNDEGNFAVCLEPQSIYSITTTEGQGKGATEPPVPKPFPLPYRDDLEADDYSDGRPARYCADQNGSFEFSVADDEKLIEQLVETKPIAWLGAGQEPFTVVGDPNWQDYRVEISAQLHGPGSVRVFGRMGGHRCLAHPGYPPPGAYQLRVDESGEWEVRRVLEDVAEHAAGGDTRLAFGKLPSFRPERWHTLALEFRSSQIRAFIDDSRLPVAEVTDSTNRRGMAGFGTGWNKARFRDLVITPVESPAASTGTSPSERNTAAHGEPPL